MGHAEADRAWAVPVAARAEPGAAGAVLGVRQAAAETGDPYAASVAYFACLGFGFIAVELALLQNLTLLLGHPIFTLAILLFTLLAAGGIGSAMSPLVAPRTACFIVAAIGAVEAIALPVVVPLLLPLPLWARMPIAVMLVAPLGLAMGVPFPRGLQSTGRGSLPPPRSTGA